MFMTISFLEKIPHGFGIARRGGGTEGREGLWIAGRIVGKGRARDDMQKRRHLWPTWDPRWHTTLDLATWLAKPSAPGGGDGR